MEGNERTWFYMIGNLKIMVHSKWIGFEYANRKGAQGWTFKCGFVHFYGERKSYLKDIAEG
jgi:hypothetical protein